MKKEKKNKPTLHHHNLSKRQQIAKGENTRKQWDNIGQYEE